ncbi:MAG: HAD family hydrolase [Actinomycetota bacterium]
MALSVGRRLDAAIFDLFGTLVPEFSSEEFFEHVRAMGRELEVDEDPFQAAWEATAHGRQTGVYPTIEANIRSFCDERGWPVDDAGMARALAIRADLYRRRFHPRTGAVQTLSSLRERGVPIALVSMCPPDIPELWRVSELAPLVDVTVFSNEVGLRKPDPAIYRVATDGLGVDPVACLYCGDGAYGELTGAEALGMTSVLIREPGVDRASQLTPERDGWEERVIDDLRELLDLFPSAAT